jgi:hypothetical protein
MIVALILFPNIVQKKKTICSLNGTQSQIRNYPSLVESICSRQPTRRRLPSMGSFVYGGRFCFFMPSYANCQPRSADPQRLLLLGGTPDEQALLCRIRGIEEGVHVRPEPPPNAAAWKCFKIFYSTNQTPFEPFLAPVGL